LSSVYPEEPDFFIPLDKITVFDFLQNLDLPHKIERWQEKLQAQTKRVKAQQEKLKSRGLSAKDKVLEELKKRTPEERLDKYRKRMQNSVERLGDRWNDTATVTMREKISFICGVLNVFICGLLIGAHPTWFHYWYTFQLAILMPARYYSYHKIGVSIHLLPPVTLHCLTHLTPAEILKERFPAIHHIRFSPPDSPDHYGLLSMMLWATVPYAVWQLAYFFLINVRRADKIAAGRPTSFTWLKKSYAKTWIGKAVLSLPEALQEAAFMMIQYSYALVTILPCPLWFWYPYASTAFLSVVFTWGVYNGATFYIDVFGNRFRKELDQLKREVAKWQSESVQVGENGQGGMSAVGSPASLALDAKDKGEKDEKSELAALPPLDRKVKSAPEASGQSTGVEGEKEQQQSGQTQQENEAEGVRNRRAGDGKEEE
ncbi:hypothetical protein KEM56_000249, partial [Ascosphaera pollenicola]